jgi:hypothetical protein
MEKNKELNQEKKCDIHVVGKAFFCGYWGSCNFKGIDNSCKNESHCDSKKETK